MCCIILCLSTKLFLNLSPLMSRYLYFSLRSSFTSVLWGSNGKRADFVRTSRLSIPNSTFPMSPCSSLSVPCGLDFTLPVRATHDSTVSPFAFSKSSIFLWATVWTLPNRSLKSIKTRLPCSLIVSTQPLTVTVLSILSGKSLVRVLSIKDLWFLGFLSFEGLKLNICFEVEI